MKKNNLNYLYEKKTTLSICEYRPVPSQLLGRRHARRATRHVAIAATEMAPVPKYVYICNIIYKWKSVYV